MAPPDSDGHAQPDPEFRLLFEQSPDILLVLLPDAPRFTMVAATDARLRATHTTRGTLGQGLFEVFPDNPDDAGASGANNLRASLERVLATRQPDTMPVQKYDIRGPDGGFTIRYWSPKNLPVLSPGGEVRYILHRVEDVTELVHAGQRGADLRGRTNQMEREVIERSQELAVALADLRGANARLAELDVAKTEFFSNISHEFRTPLTLMLAPLEDALAEPGTNLQRVRLEMAHRNALRLLRLVNTLLDFSRLEAGRLGANFEPVDLAAETAELAGIFRLPVERGGLSFTVDCPALPQPVHVDRAMWDQVVLNLVSNAFKHTFQGGITVRLRNAGATAVLTVEDTGIGIAAEELPRLFERFHRVRGAASRSHEGTGIGLSMVRELVTLHGGTVAVESEPGKGSRFTVTLQMGTSHLPAAHIGAAPPAATARDTAAGFLQEAVQWLPATGAAEGMTGKPPAEERRPGERRARIIWADDNPDMRDYVSQLLAAEFDVTAVEDGEAALRAARADPPDLVLSDVMMPRLDGFGLLRSLRAHERTRTIPVILLSARAGEEAALQGIEKGADDYLAKPFSTRELLVRVRTHVALGRERRTWQDQLEHQVRERTQELSAEITRRESTEAQLKSQLERMDLLAHITRAIGERQDLRSIFQVVVRNVEESLPAMACWIALDGPDTEGFPIPDTTTYEPGLHGPPALLPAALAGARIGSYVAAPLPGETRAIGVLMAARRDAAAFDAAEIEFLRQLAEHVGLAVRQAQLHESLWAAYEELRQTQQAVLQQERLGALGQMASGIAHDINNAITPAMLYVENLLESQAELGARARQSLPIVLRAIEDVAATVARLREFYRPREMQAEQRAVNLNPLVEQVIELTRARWSDMPQQRGIVVTVEKTLAEGLPTMLGSESELREALTNLVLNAVDAMPDGGTLTLRTSSAPRAAVLEVSDTGIGMDEETRRKCLEPFFTTKGERGNGLGLAMVYGIVQRHGAEIEIASTPGTGTTMRIVFPLPDEIIPATGTTSRLPVIPDRLKLLVIDDDAQLLQSLRETLELDGHEVVTAGSGSLGIDTFRAALDVAPFSIVITDLGMPRLDGRAVARTIKEISPLTPVILLTGWGQRPDQGNDVLPHIDRVLGKPPKLRELRAALSACCAETSAIR